MKCPHCEVENVIGTKHCRMCGKKMEMSFNEVQDSVYEDDALEKAERFQTVMIRLFLVLLFCWLTLGIFNKNSQIIPVFSSRVSATLDTPSFRPFGSRTASGGEIIEYAYPSEIILNTAPAVQKKYLPKRIRSEYTARARGDKGRVMAAVDKYIQWLCTIQELDGSFVAETSWDESVQHLSRAGGCALGAAVLALRGPHSFDVKTNNAYKRAMFFLTSDIKAGKSEYSVYDRSFLLYSLSLCLMYFQREGFEESARTIADRLLVQQTDEGGWTEPGDSRNVGTAETALALLALETARDAGLTIEYRVPPAHFLELIQHPTRKRILKNTEGKGEPVLLTYAAGLLIPKLIHTAIKADIEMNCLNYLDKRHKSPWEKTAKPGSGNLYNWCAALALRQYESGYWYTWAEDFSAQAVKNQNPNGSFKYRTSLFTEKDSVSAKFINTALIALALETYWYP